MRRYNPGPAFRMTSPWNPQRKHPVSGVVRPHRGEDWAAPSGTPVPAAAYGVVVFKNFVDGYGNIVVLEHETQEGEVIHTLYAHMRESSPLKIGDIVYTADSVGNVGNTGIGTGPHLHFEIIPNGSKRRPNLRKGHLTINPAVYDLAQLKGVETEEDSAAGENDPFGEKTEKNAPGVFDDDWLLGGKNGKRGGGVIGPAFEYARTSLDIGMYGMDQYSYGAPHELRWFQPEAD